MGEDAAYCYLPVRIDVHEYPILINLEEYLRRKSEATSFTLGTEKDNKYSILVHSHLKFVKYQDVTQFPLYNSAFSFLFHARNIF